MVPFTIVVMGFNLVSAVFGVLYYLGFLGYSLQRTEPKVEDDKSEDLEEAGKTNECIATHRSEHREQRADDILFYCTKSIFFSYFFLYELSAEEEEEEEQPTIKGIAYLIVGGLLIFIFSNPFIHSIVQGAYALDVRNILISEQKIKT